MYKVPCPVCGHDEFVGNMQLHASMEHPFSDRKTIYDFLIEEQFRSKYAISSERSRAVVGKASPHELLTFLTSGTPPRFGLGAVTVGRRDQLDFIHDLLYPGREYCGL